MLSIVLVLAIAFGLQLFLSTIQMKNFNRAYIEMRRKGKVAIGRKAGGFFAGAIVMFRIDDDGIIQEGRKIEGSTWIARVKPFPGYEGRNVAELTREDGPRNHRNLGLALENAADNYKRFVSGEEIPETPSPVQKVGGMIGRKFRTNE
jgi:glucitol operon activator protein